jgi:threonyl-tRNA synthetase
VRISLSDPKAPEKYLGEPAVWREMENTLRQVAHDLNLKTSEAPGEAAFYGPKMDFMVEDSLGRRWQVATIQLDMNLPERFDLTCVNEQGAKERIVMVHAAIMGSIERFLAVLLEHTGGHLPLWLAPEQVRILPIGEAHLTYAQEILAALQTTGTRAELDASGDSLGKKIRDWKTSKTPYAVVLGDEELKNKTLTVESARGGKETLSLAELTVKLKEKIKNKN